MDPRRKFKETGVHHMVEDSVNNDVVDAVFSEPIVEKL